MTNGRIDKLSQQLKEVKEAFDDWQNSGINPELLVIWIMHKTKMPKSKVKDMLHAQKDFFNNLIKEEVVERLTK